VGAADCTAITARDSKTAPTEDAIKLSAVSACTSGSVMLRCMDSLLERVFENDLKMNGVVQLGFYQELAQKLTARTDHNN
jgi:hypothetical protein